MPTIPNNSGPLIKLISSLIKLCLIKNDQGYYRDYRPPIYCEAHYWLASQYKKTSMKRKHALPSFMVEIMDLSKFYHSEPIACLKTFPLAAALCVFIVENSERDSQFFKMQPLRPIPSIHLLSYLSWMALLSIFQFLKMSNASNKKPSLEFFLHSFSYRILKIPCSKFHILILGPVSKLALQKNSKGLDGAS